MIEQGKQLIAQLQQENKELKEENEDKDEDRRLRQYEIDVRAMLETAKLTQHQHLTLMLCRCRLLKSWRKTSWVRLHPRQT